MSSLIQLYESLTDLSVDQLAAVKKGDFEEAARLMEKRHQIIHEIQKNDGQNKLHLSDESATDGNDVAANDCSRVIACCIRKILSNDNEISNLVRKEQAVISDNLSSIKKMKTFIRNNAYVNEGTNLSLSV